LGHLKPDGTNHVVDFLGGRYGQVEDVPGEEWTSNGIAEQLGIDCPAISRYPSRSIEEDSAGNAMWHHVITIEPAFDLVENPLQGSPFVIRPYETAIGSVGPGVPRTILYAHDPPTARVRSVPGT